MSSNDFTLVRPLAVTDSVLTSSTVAEPAVTTDPDPAAWDGTVAYAKDTQVTRASIHKIFQRLVLGTTATAPELDSTNWVEVGPTNRWKMFDAANETQTTHATSIVVVITPNAVIDYLAFDNVDADSIRVQVGSYDQTITMKTRVVDDWWKYFFEPFRYKRTAVFTSLPPLTAAPITITITKTGGIAKCGTCVPGLSKVIGSAEAGASVGIIDYSRKTTDTFGKTTVVPRAYSKRMNVRLLVDADLVDDIQQLLALYRAVPVIWVGAGNIYGALVVYGYYRSFEIVIPYPNQALCNLEVEGLT